MTCLQLRLLLGIVKRAVITPHSEHVTSSQWRIIRQGCRVLSTLGSRPHVARTGDAVWTATCRRKTLKSFLCGECVLRLIHSFRTAKSRCSVGTRWKPYSSGGVKLSPWTTVWLNWFALILFVFTPLWIYLSYPCSWARSQVSQAANKPDHQLVKSMTVYMIITGHNKSKQNGPEAL